MSFKEVSLTDEIQELIHQTYCFTAAEGMHGFHLNRQHSSKSIDPRLHAVVIAVVTLHNGETFVGYTVCRKNATYDFQTACSKAKDKAYRKLKDHVAKQKIGTLI